MPDDNGRVQAGRTAATVERVLDEIAVVNGKLDRLLEWRNAVDVKQAKAEFQLDNIENLYCKLKVDYEAQKESTNKSVSKHDEAIDGLKKRDWTVALTAIATAIGAGFVSAFTRK